MLVCYTEGCNLTISNIEIGGHQMNLVSRGIYIDKKYEEMATIGAWMFACQNPKTDTQKFSYVFMNPETLFKIKMLFVP